MFNINFFEEAVFGQFIMYLFVMPNIFKALGVNIFMILIEC